MTVNRQWRLAKRPEGMIGEANFEFVETTVPKVTDQQILVKNLYFSFDPTQRGWAVDRPSYLPPVGIGEVMRAGTVGQVVLSNHDDFSEGDLVQTMGGWQDYAVITPGEGVTGVTKVPEGVTPEMMLSVIGLTGITAYFGLLELGQPKAGETVLISGAAGATGSVASQIAKIKGCRVVGIAGGPEKCRWLTEVAGLDAAIDYKAGPVAEMLQADVPSGIDIYFDNVGGETLDAALMQINRKALIIVCGGISQYGDMTTATGPANYLQLISKSATMTGFTMLDYMHRIPEALTDLSAWVEDGSLRHRQHILEGIESFPEGLRMLFLSLIHI